MKYLLFILLCLNCSAESLQLSRWKAASIEPRYEHESQMIVARIMKNKIRYDYVSSKTNVPWYVIAGLHNMESGGSFKMHLHEGSPLTSRTRYVPKGRPKTGYPPFTWEYSAIDALKYDNLGYVTWSSLTQSIYACVKYNGLGYLLYHKNVPSPYFWAGTSIEVAGKYKSDGVWDRYARSSQLGICVIWKTMQSMRILDFNRLNP